MYHSFVAIFLVAMMMLMNIFMTWKGFEGNGLSPFQELTVTTSAQSHIQEVRGLACIFWVLVVIDAVHTFWQDNWLEWDLKGMRIVIIVEL